MRRGISPVIATVIIVAVAIAIAIAVAGWLMGLWGGYARTETVMIMPDSHIEITGNQTTLHLHLKNSGSATARIYKIVVNGEEHSTSVELPPGADQTIDITLSGTYRPGSIYNVIVYTEAGSVVSAPVSVAVAR